VTRIAIWVFVVVAAELGCQRPAHSPRAPGAASIAGPAVMTGRGPYVAEGLPSELQEALVRVNARDAITVKGHGRNEYVIRRTRRWQCGSTVSVGFLGGAPSLRAGIVDATAEWTNKGNVKLDFGSSADGYRSWAPSDQTYTAEIRISFNDPEGGYWSLVGKDSVDPEIVRPGHASMNFEGFATQLPPNWSATVIHEFGHALGFEHEHQHPQRGCDFLWDDDPGYQHTTDSFGQFVRDAQGRRPSVYTVLGGRPNNWDRAKVDFNLRKLPNTRAFKSSPLVDRDSIMKYYFDDWMFEAGANSPCYSSVDNAHVSAKDAQGVAWAYPAICLE
jgi:hypothetical protein